MIWLITSSNGPPASTSSVVSCTPAVVSTSNTNNSGGSTSDAWNRKGKGRNDIKEQTRNESIEEKRKITEKMTQEAIEVQKTEAEACKIEAETNQKNHILARDQFDITILEKLISTTKNAEKKTQYEEEYIELLESKRRK